MGNELSRVSQPPAVTGIVLLACFMGVVVPIYAGIMGDSLARLAALPALVTLGILLVFSRKLLFLVILLFRASGDIFFESTRFSLAGYPIGVGGLINAFVILIALLLVVEQPGILSKKVFTIWGLFLLTALCGAVVAPVKTDALRLYLQLFSYFAVFVSALYVVRSAHDFKFCVRIVLWSSVLPAIYALVDTGLNAGASGIAEFRVQSTFSHPNIFAFYLTLVIPLALYMLKSSSVTLSTGKRLVLTAYMIFLLALLLLTQARSAWVACFAMFAVYGLIFERRYLVYVVVAPLLALVIPSVHDRLLDLAVGNEYVLYAKLNSFAWRQLIWKSALQWMEPAHYFLGYGLDSFKYYAPTFFPLAGGVNWGAHSVYVQLLFEVGAAGLLAFMWLFGRLLWLLRLMVRVDKLGAFISIALIVQYLIISLSDNMLAYLSFNWYLFFMLGAACAAVLTGWKPRPEASQATRLEHQDSV